MNAYISQHAASKLRFKARQYINLTRSMMAQPSYTRSFTKTFHKVPYDHISPTSPNSSVKGKTIIITAGHTGIGRSIASSFA